MSNEAVPSETYRASVDLYMRHASGVGMASISTCPALLQSWVQFRRDSGQLSGVLGQCARRAPVGRLKVDQLQINIQRTGEFR